jgi:ubiquinone/menaquinone biosynthesis C-methylase UbiE
MKSAGTDSFAEKSYFLHKQHLEEYLRKEKLTKHSETWMSDNTVDAWRHKRMYEFILPIIKSYPGAVWLTVGDGRYGSDAHFLEESGATKVLATDISDSLLKIGKRRGFILNYKKENAEKLSFKNASFDFVLCKESFHHFPRPMVAFYEMLRVARKGVFLIEPDDSPSGVQSRVMRFMGRGKPSPIGGFFNSFENAGNYVYKISPREIEKAALALQLPELAYTGIDDLYLKGVEYLNAGKFSFTFLAIKAVLFLMDVIYKLGMRKRSLLIAIVFKEKPVKVARRRLCDAGFKLVDLPANPFLG